MQLSRTSMNDPEGALLSAGNVTSLLETDDALRVSLVGFDIMTLFRTEAIVEDLVLDASILSDSLRNEETATVRSLVDSVQVTVELLSAVLKSAEEVADS
ncbi:hypothetical protein OGATHE_003161 [Ogataea polymorpha]|uniref:Uncharacterized protein n=1 Tax=Ogataea polymorpha TaxID=460523 RepID=A0A9P8T627_9ASCO|nr:hypothetical protein OGATHE_003161 [Ogataea polymorpha]